MLVQLDQVIDRGVLTVAPTAAGRGWDIDWLRPLAQRPVAAARPRRVDAGSRFQEALERCSGSRDGAGDRIVPHGR